MKKLLLLSLMAIGGVGLMYGHKSLCTTIGSENPVNVLSVACDDVLEQCGSGATAKKSCFETQGCHFENAG